jgi:catechol 2,3-dioxygenase-like lactoylglutathione lyase family enzyme
MTDAQTALPIQGVITVFYYDDVRGALDFYERVIGLRKVADFGWGGIVELCPNACLGLVNATEGSQRPIAGFNKGAILSIATQDLELCFETLRTAGAVPHGTVIEPGCGGRSREFKIRDPGGYTIEFCTWLVPLS